MKFGLEQTQIVDIQKIISSNSRIEQVILFGSRAKGNYRPGSDIDMAVVGGELKLDDLLEIGIELEALNYPMKFDLVLYHQVKDDEVLDHIRRVGIRFYEKGRQ
jgi:predicted nucleotidyltransferase